MDDTKSLTPELEAKIRPLRGRVAIVTGGNRGIGRAIASRLADDGASVMLAARDVAMLEATALEIRAAGGRVATCPLDLRESSAPLHLVEATMRAWGAIDIVINNAGATKRRAGGRAWSGCRACTSPRRAA